MYKILLVEDDRAIAQAICRHITAWGLQIKAASNFRDIMAEFVAYEPQLVLLDISLPFFNGYHWCEQIRQVSRVPIIFISSAADNLNIIMAINQGADDFIAKPFDLTVLTAKIQAALRRAYNFTGLAGQAAALQHRGATLNLANASLTYQGQSLDLSKNDLRILQVLLENQGSVVSRSTLMERLWATNSFIDENTLTVSVARLRKKLDAIGLTDFISTKKGLGYIIS